MGLPAGLDGLWYLSVGYALVYIAIIWNGAPYPLELAYPPILGIGFSIAYPIWVLKNTQIFNLQTGKIHLKRAVKRIRMKEALEL